MLFPEDIPTYANLLYREPYAPTNERLLEQQAQINMMRRPTTPAEQEMSRSVLAALQGGLGNMPDETARAFNLVGGPSYGSAMAQSPQMAAGGPYGPSPAQTSRPSVSGAGAGTQGPQAGVPPMVTARQLAGQIPPGQTGGPLPSGGVGGAVASVRGGSVSNIPVPQTYGELQMLAPMLEKFGPIAAAQMRAQGQLMWHMANIKQQQDANAARILQERFQRNPEKAKGLADTFDKANANYAQIEREIADLESGRNIAGEVLNPENKEKERARLDDELEKASRTRVTAHRAYMDYLNGPPEMVQTTGAARVIQSPKGGGKPTVTPIAGGGARSTRPQPTQQAWTPPDPDARIGTNPVAHAAWETGFSSSPFEAAKAILSRKGAISKTTRTRILDQITTDPTFASDFRSYVGDNYPQIIAYLKS